MKEKSIVGDLINFRGLVYSPTNKNGVIFLFGKVMEDLNMYIEEIKPGFPDCIGRRFTGKGWEKAYIEFEYKSSHFKGHSHNPPESVGKLFHKLDNKVKKISEEIWYKVTGHPGVTYYSPERVFVYLHFQMEHYSFR